MPATAPEGYVALPLPDGQESFERRAGPIYVRRDNPANEMHFALVPERHHCNPIGAVHGGYLVTAADTMMGSVVFRALAPGHVCATIGLNCEFLAGGRVGETIYGRAWARRMGRTLAFLACEMRMGEKPVFAATGQWAIFPAKG